ncbi:hypothetical protein H4S02_008799 [Coemansia sp. RSA 2611]|nr:hypothetical protein IWW54_005902 [Coemansia sp. RSA 2705]KAJ2309890.1 hypothetical protein IWW52_005569 [Coemansia sp. RSA 2704]KAJ2373612.1 hypothetical protein H4S02_008799 [Coemansia sp. RSA 2611]KAJ2721948.1 hypothetical protein H4R23_004531 [Coemansia sp. Cherry 401B]
MCDFIFIPILCGTWDQVRSLGPELIPCPRCHNNAIQTIRRRTWMTLYCIPVFPISRKRQLYHCDICRWEGIPASTIQTHRRRRRSPQNRSLYLPSSSPQPATPSPHFQPVQYSQNEYEAPPPPYSKET